MNRFYNIYKYASNWKFSLKIPWNIIFIFRIYLSVSLSRRDHSIFNLKYKLMHKLVPACKVRKCRWLHRPK